VAQSGPKTSTSVLDTSPIHPNSIDMVTFSPNAPQFSFGVLCSVGGACGGFVVDGNGQYWFEIETLHSDIGVSDGHCLEIWRRGRRWRELVVLASCMLEREGKGWVKRWASDGRFTRTEQICIRIARQRSGQLALRPQVVIFSSSRVEGSVNI